MRRVSIEPQWTIRQDDGQTLSPRLLALLLAVHEKGSLAAACLAMGASYRHAWDLVRQGEAMFGAPLLSMQRGRGSNLTELGARLVWADLRINARLTPALESLASELEAEIRAVLDEAAPPLRVHASHGFAIETLFRLLGEGGMELERRYLGSHEAVVSLANGACDIAGFHIPVGEFEAEVLARYTPWFDLRTHRVLCLATRRQGLMVAPGNPAKIYSLRDLVRSDVRFINRQLGSGTRLLLECMLRREGIAPAAVHGFESGEFTHAAVAAFVASKMADVGFGIETPARQFGLEFIPVASERYFLLLDERALSKPQVQSMLALLRSDAFRLAVNRLSGYAVVDPGEVQTVAEAFAPMLQAELANEPSPAGLERGA